MRTPTELLARFNRQLLVDGVDLARQVDLQKWGVVAATDGFAVAALIADACSRYLVGAGVGRLCANYDDAATIELDSQLQVVEDAALVEPPVVHLYIAARAYGASADVVATEDATGWAVGKSRNARVSTIAFDFERRADAGDAPFVGAAIADLVLSDLLGLEPIPAIARFEMHGAAEPKLHTEAGRPMVAASVKSQGNSSRSRPGNKRLNFSLANFARYPAAYHAVVADCLANYPNEACGFVVRTAEGGFEAVVCRNLQDRYHELDPTTYRRTARTAFKLNEMKIARAIEAGQELVCIYHSHCDAGAYFSDEDVACAVMDGEPLYPGVEYLVVSVFGGSLRGAELYTFDPNSGGFKPADDVVKERADRTIKRLKKTYSEAVRKKSSGAWTWDLGSGTMRFDAAWKAQLGYTDEEIRDDPQSWFDRLFKADSTRVREGLRALIKGDAPLFQEELRVQHRDGSYLWVRVTAAVEHRPNGDALVTGTQEDITAVKLAELRMSYVEQHDRLTGLLNVDPFVVQLHERMQNQSPGALVICDLEDFADVNRRFERLTGDDTLISVAGLLEDQLDRDALIGRLTGDDFAFVVSLDQAEAIAKAESIRDELLAETFVARNGETYGVNPKLAVGIPPADCRHGREWLDHVFLALRGDARDGVVVVRATEEDS